MSHLLYYAIKLRYRITTFTTCRRRSRMLFTRKTLVTMLYRNLNFYTVSRVRTHLIAVDRHRRRSTAVDGRYASTRAFTAAVRTLLYAVALYRRNLTDISRQHGTGRVNT